MIKSAPYLRHVLDKEKIHELVERAVAAISKVKPDVIVGRGVSGSLLGVIVAYKLNIPYVHVRKGESCHSLHGVEGESLFETYVIIDDLIESGATIRHIISQVKDFNALAQLRAIYLYCGESESGENFKEWAKIEKVKLHRYFSVRRI